MADRAAWLSSNLGIGIYVDEIAPRDQDTLRRSRWRNMFHTHGRSLTANDFGNTYRDKDDVLYFGFARPDQAGDELYLHQHQLMDCLHKNKAAFFSFSYPAETTAVPMQIASRARVDKSVDRAALQDAIQAVETNASVKIIKPRVL